MFLSTVHIYINKLLHWKHYHMIGSVSVYSFSNSVQYLQYSNVTKLNTSKFCIVYVIHCTMYEYEIYSSTEMGNGHLFFIVYITALMWKHYKMCSKHYLPQFEMLSAQAEKLILYKKKRLKICSCVHTYPDSDRWPSHWNNSVSHFVT
jgi:hypothetical protein